VTRPRTRLNTTVLNTPDARELASFYERLLGWQRVNNDADWVTLSPPVLRTGLSFQSEPGFVAPAWPPDEGKQRVTAHLDIAVDDLEAGVAWALELGARIADHQPNRNVRVMVDPAGHVFCLFAGEFP
jgi:catechol 2,3-dioxygenase-like lactoylglutathione lyase family enzyme